MLAAYPVGGVAIFGKNISDPETLRAFTEQLRDATTVPLFLGVDEEGGLVARLANNAAFGLPKYESAAAVGASGNPADAENMGRTIGGYLADYGFTVDFAPVADVYTNPANTVIGSRAFATDANTAAAMAGACARGLASQGVLPVYKHFPGHGDTAEDSHNGLAVTYKTHDELAACEWIPYSTNDLTGCAVMVGHIAAPNVTGDSHAREPFRYDDHRIPPRRAGLYGAGDHRLHGDARRDRRLFVRQRGDRRDRGGR